MNKLIDILKELKSRGSIIGVKGEFETEGAEYEDMCELKELATKANIMMEIKIGGCGAIRDIKQCKKLKADIIVAPMIETEYALKKFIESIHIVYNRDKIPLLYINIETITGIKNIESILKSEAIKDISAIILGRGDLSNSMNIEDVSDKKITNIIKDVYRKTIENNKKFIIGGKVKPDETEIMRKYADYIETRKIIFNKEISSYDIEKAIEFEINWITNKKNKNGNENKRIKELEKRIEKRRTR